MFKLGDVKLHKSSNCTYGLETGKHLTQSNIYLSAALQLVNLHVTAHSF